MSHSKEEELKIEGHHTNLHTKQTPPPKSKPAGKTGKLLAHEPLGTKPRSTIGTKATQKNTLLGNKAGAKAKHTFEEKKDPAANVLSAYETRIISNLISNKQSLQHILTDEEKFRRVNL